MLRKKLSFYLALLASVTGTLQAAGYYECCETPNYNNDCCYDACNPCNDFHFFFRGELLYWKPYISGLDLAFGNGTIAATGIGAAGVTTTTEYDVDPHFNWNTGYRVGGGIGLGSLGLGDELEVDVFYTHFHGRGHRHVTQNPEVTNYGSTKIKLQQLDILFAYNKNFSEATNLKPFFGLRLNKIHTDLNSTLVTDITIAGTALPLIGTQTRFFDDYQRYRAIGPVLGFEGEYGLGCGLGIYGSVAFGVLYGDYSVNFDDATITTVPTVSEIISTRNRHIHGFDYNVDWAIGLSWETTVLCDYKLEARVGFEQHQYFNQNRLGPCRGDLTFNGGVFSLGIAL